jgi:hypothetical protein
MSKTLITLPEPPQKIAAMWQLLCSKYAATTLPSKHYLSNISMYFDQNYCSIYDPLSKNFIKPKTDSKALTNH